MNINQGANSLLKRIAIINGLLLGCIVAILSIFRFYYVTKMVTSPILIVAGYHTLFPIFLPLTSAVYFVLKLRKKIGGYWSFKHAVRGIFIVFITAYFTQFLIVDMLFIKIMEPRMLDKTELALINASKADFRRRHVNQKDVDQKIKEIQSNLGEMKTITVGQQIQTIGITIIFLFVLALAFAGFFRRELVYYSPK